jgi:hypothetical protein
MSKTKVNYGVVISKQAHVILKDEPLAKIIEDDRVIYCTAIDSNGQYLHLTVAREHSSLRHLNLLLPHAFVLYIYSYPAGKNLGFENA